MKLALRIVGLALISVCLALAGLGLESVVPDNASPEAVAASAKSARFGPLPSVDAQAGPSILERSPFATDRSAFNRDTAMTPPPPPVEVKLTGIFKIGKTLHASLLVGGQSIMVKKGDEIAVGKIAKVEASAVEIEGPNPQRLEMFRRQ
jgi:hypothetical protein